MKENDDKTQSEGMAQIQGSDGENSGGLEKAEIEYGKAAVARDPRQNMIILGIALLVIGFVSYYFIGGSTKEIKKPTTNDFPLETKAVQSRSIQAPVVGGGGRLSTESAINPDKFLNKPPAKEEIRIEQPVLKPSITPPAPPPPPVLQPTSIATLSTTELAAAARLEQQQKQTKAKSGIMLSGGGSGVAGGKSANEDKRDLDVNFLVQPTSAVSTKLTQIGNMSSVIVQGKVIEAILETPLNTNYPGPMRALISRDVFSEQGENVLIPKGSRVVGKFDGGYRAGQNRITLKWDRIILPNGYDLMLKDAPGTDSLGRLGVPGDVHREFFNTIGNALLLSVINVAFAEGLEKGFSINKNATTTTVLPDGTQTQTTTTGPVQEAATQQVKQLGDITQQWVKQNFLTTPSVTVDQGTVIKVFVNQDLVFPSSISSGVNLIK